MESIRIASGGRGVLMTAFGAVESPSRHAQRLQTLTKPRTATMLVVLDRV